MALPPLPSSADLIRQFGLFGTDPLLPCTPKVDSRGALSCSCDGCRHWKQYSKGHLDGFCTWPQYEVLTQELILGLAEYIRSRCEVYRLPAAVVLELGAGDGRLSRYLSAQMDDESISVVCSDSGLRQLHVASPHREHVVLLPAEDALARFQPHIVLVSWMPFGVDFTASIRATESVREYILVGEAEGGICGDPWLTWGTADSDSCSEDESEEDRQNRCPHVHGGFWRRDLEHLKAHQVCCTDERWLPQHHSCTVAFLRLEGLEPKV